MKRFLGTMLIFCCGKIAAQNLSLAVMPGVSNYAGDLQKASYTFNASNLCGTAAIMYNEGHFTIRAGLFLGKVEASDSATSSFEPRNLSFQSNITEGHLMLQYDILDLNKEHRFTPYLMAGVGIYSFNPYALDAFGKKTDLQPLGTEGQLISNTDSKDPYKLTQFNIPAGIGLKFKISESFTAGLEFCTRLLYTDHLDDVSSIRYPDQNQLSPEARFFSYRGQEINPNAVLTPDMKRGNPNNEDNFYSSSLVITYRLFPSGGSGGRFENGAGGKRSKKGGFMSCPRKVS